MSGITGKPKRTFLYILALPAATLCVGFSGLIALQNVEMLQEALVYVWWAYFSFAVTLFVVILLVVILAAVALGSVYDDVHLRGELLFSSVVLCMTVVTQLVIYVLDVYSGFSTGIHSVLTQITHFLYCALSTLAAFSVMAVSTQYVAYVAARTPKIPWGMGDSENGRFSMSKTDVDFQALISTRHGLAGFIAYLAKQMNEQQLHHLVVG